jgi:hypothetical protein
MAKLKYKAAGREWPVAYKLNRTIAFFNVYTDIELLKVKVSPHLSRYGVSRYAGTDAIDVKDRPIARTAEWGLERVHGTDEEGGAIAESSGG